MACWIEIDGINESVLGVDDLVWTLHRHGLGYEFTDGLLELFEESSQDEKSAALEKLEREYIDELQIQAEHYHRGFNDVTYKIEELKTLLDAPRLNRKKLHDVAMQAIRIAESYW